MFVMLAFSVSAFADGISSENAMFITIYTNEMYLLRRTRWITFFTNSVDLVMKIFKSFTMIRSKPNTETQQ